MIYTCSSDQNYDDLCSFVDHSLKLLNTYQFLTDSFIPEFFVQDQWNSLPVIWRLAFETFTIEDVHKFIQAKHLNHKVLPLSLLCFQQCSKIYKFKNEEHRFSEDYHRNREDKNEQTKTETNKQNKNEDVNDKTEIKKEVQNEIIKLDSNINYGFNQNKDGHFLNNVHESAISSNQRIKPELFKLFHRNLNNHLKPKKIYEIDRLSNIINAIADHNCTLYDVGSGSGHLSRRLAFKFNFKIISVDTNANLLLNAKQYDDRLIDKFNFLNANQKPKQLQYTMSEDNYIELVKNEQNYGLIGLHSCGNLGHDLLELHKNSTSKYLFLCSCCYHKTNENRYLISKYLKNRKTILTVETRATACHSLDNFIDLFKTKPGELKVHAYRALIEYLFEMKSPKNRKKTLARIHGLTNSTFLEYIEQVTKKLIENNEFQLDDLNLDNETVQSIIETKLNQSLNIIIFFSLRILLAPVTESIILADRMLYLYENSRISSKLIPIYDAKISPRNFLLVSCKL